MKKLLIAAFAIAAIVSCKKTVIDSQPDQGFGYISFNLSADSEMTVVTKAEIPADELETYNVSLFKESELLWSKDYAEITDEDLKVEVGNYRLYVENITEAEATPELAKGEAWLVGEAENVAVKSGITTPVAVECTPANSRVTVAYDDSFSQVFQNPQVTVTGKSRAFDMLWGHDAENGVYYPGSTEITWSLTAALSGDSSVSKNYKSLTPVTTVAGKWTQITFSTSSTDGSINVVITADDTFKEIDEVVVPVDPFQENVIVE